MANHLSEIEQHLGTWGLLSEANLNLVEAHPESENLCSAIAKLSEKQILNANRFKALIQHAKPWELMWLISELHQADALDNHNEAFYLSLPNPEEILNALPILRQANLFKPDIIKLLGQHLNPCMLAWALTNLEQAEILTDENSSKLCQHPLIENFGEMLDELQKLNLLSQANFDLVYSHPDIHWLANILMRLKHVGILNQAYFNAIAQHLNPHGLAWAVYYLAEFDFLDEDRFLQIINPSHAVLLEPEMIYYFWNRIPGHLLRANWQNILLLAQGPQATQNLLFFMNQLMEPITVQQEQFNVAQSTHTASVHQSVSASASKLMQRYGQNFNCEASINTIKFYAQGLSSSLPHQAARRALLRISKPSYVFQDPTSEISTRQLLALSWKAIHDDALRIGSLDDARNQMISGLYEIQRGYNIDEQGHDDGAPDKPICSAGTFNKLIEKLHGVHQDAEIVYITKQSAGLKLPIVLKQELIAYLKACSNDVRETFLSNFLLTDALWADIKTNVSHRMQDEFMSAFSNQEDFNELIDCGQCYSFSDEDKIMITRELTQEPHINGFFSGASAENQSNSARPSLQ